MLFLKMAVGSSKTPILFSFGTMAFINFDGLYAHFWTPWTLRYLPYHEEGCASKFNHPSKYCACIKQQLFFLSKAKALLLICKSYWKVA